MKKNFMDKILWKYVKPLKNEEIIKNFLQEHNIELPKQLIECITKNNGGRPSTYLFDTNKGKEYVFQSLFSYNYEDKNSIYKIYSSIFENSILYPLGIDASGNIVCYHQEKKTYVLWKHENDELEDILIKE